MVGKWKNSKLLILLLLTGAVYFFLKFITPLTAPVLIAMLFVTIFGPFLKKMQEKLHIHRQIGTLCLLLAVGILLALIVWVLFSWIVGSLPEWIRGLDVVYEEITVVVHGVCETVGRVIGVDAVYLEDTILSRMEEGIAYFRQQAVPGMLSQSWQYVKIVGAVGGFLVTFVIAAVLLAKDYDEIMNRMLDREDCHMFLEIICGIIRYIATFVKAQLIIMSVLAGISALVLGVSNIQHGALWGLLAGILDALPFVGTGIVLIPLAISQFFSGNYARAFVCILLYLVCVFLRELLEPRLIGRRIGVSPIAILLSLYAGIQLFGVWGILKGPLGFILIYETYLSLRRRSDELTKNTE